jgi:hypothetical protein
MYKSFVVNHKGEIRINLNNYKPPPTSPEGEASLRKYIILIFSYSPPLEGPEEALKIRIISRVKHVFCDF